MHKPVTCSALEVLDLHSCVRLGDSCLSNISRLTSLTSLNLRGAYLITDSGMAVLGQSNTPISCLCLRHCRKITDKGISLLLRKEGKIAKTLSSLNLSNIHGLSDNAVTTIVDACAGLTELCIRHSRHITDASMMSLGLKGTLEGETKYLRRLDIYACYGLSVELFELLKKPLFGGLQWIGVGSTSLQVEQDDWLTKICAERRYLTICSKGCEMGCLDRWQFHPVGY